MPWTEGGWVRGEGTLSLFSSHGGVCVCLGERGDERGGGRRLQNKIIGGSGGGRCGEACGGGYEDVCCKIII